MDKAILKVLIDSLTKDSTMSPYGSYKPYYDPNGMVRTTFTTGVSDDEYEYVVPGVKNGAMVKDPYMEMKRTGEYFARFRKSPLSRALSNSAGELIHKWQKGMGVPK